MSRSADQVGNQWLARTLWELGGVRFGDFTLGRTTVHSPVYVNPRRLISRPNALRRAARVIEEEVRTLQSMRNPQVQEFELVAGIPIGGLHLATAFSLRTRVPMVYLHPKPGNPEVTAIEGLYTPGQRVLIIDDLVNRGGSIVTIATALREAGLQVTDAVVLIDRQVGAKERLRDHGCHLVSILGLEQLLNFLMSTEKVDERVYRKSLDYIERERQVP